MNSYYQGFARTRQQAIEAIDADPADRYVPHTRLRHRMGLGLIELGRYLLRDHADLRRAA